MNTRLVMAVSALALGAAGILLSFAPELGLSAFGVPLRSEALLLGQVIGALYFGFAMLNWMSKDATIGGIYNRPLLVANLSHFLIAGLAIIKQLLSGSELPATMWAAGGLYAVFILLFGRMLYTHPLPAKQG